MRARSPVLLLGGGAQLSLLLLSSFQHSAKTSIAQEERLATSRYSVTRLHLLHALVVRLYER